MFSGEVNTLELPITSEQYEWWQNGGLIQDVMPGLTASQREFLITGTTDQEWSDFLGFSEK
jgi:uncharacterized protein (DUF779 family)